MENTHNRAGGAVWPPDALHAAVDAARESGLAVHLDGARLWNAAAATGRSPAELIRGIDTVSVCFSKGLGAPVGSAVVSRADLIDRARYLRKRLGGGMRQAGIIAAGALHALRHHRERLVEDHRRAAVIAASLAGVRGIRVLPVESNIIIVDVAETGRTPGDVVAALEREGLRALGVGKSRVRLVTHLDLGDDAVEHACRVLPRVLEAGR
jgi:threonine aldolase